MAKSTVWEERFAQTELEAKAVLERERVERAIKTAKLRELRLAKLNEATAPEPAAVKKSKRTVVMIKAAMAKRRRS